MVKTNMLTDMPSGLPSILITMLGNMYALSLFTADIKTKTTKPGPTCFAQHIGKEPSRKSRPVPVSVNRALVTLRYARGKGRTRPQPFPPCHVPLPSGYPDRGDVVPHVGCQVFHVCGHRTAFLPPLSATNVSTQHANGTHCGVLWSHA